jgi:hypothetical protein
MAQTRRLVFRLLYFSYSWRYSTFGTKPDTNAGPKTASHFGDRTTDSIYLDQGI